MPGHTNQQTLNEAAQWLKRELGTPPPIGIVLGSGLGGFADRLEQTRAHAYAQIPHAPAAAVSGHAGKLIAGRIGGVELVALSGRVHAYEGHSLEDVVFLSRALAKWGVPRMVLTNAAGGINTAFSAGDIMLILDHLNLSGRNPLSGENDESVGPRFLDLTRAYDPAMTDVLRQAALSADIAVKEGVYCGLLGPTYETPAEVRMLRTLGADAVGMSTVPETIALRHMGVRVAAVSCITNLAAGITGEPLSHAEVKQVADQSAARLTTLFSMALPRMASC